MTDKKKRKIIIYHVNASQARQQSNMMHELAHIICKHEIIIPDGHILPGYMRYFDKFQEAEAAYLGGCFQLSQPYLILSIKGKYIRRR
jgi:Zn-dependent peptidase ImmA (M78 family)